MAIPNTTPTPNELFNGEMKKMTDAELRVVMIVTRATFGWVMDENTGMRKEEDWISLSQMVEKSGKSPRAIKYAIQGCVEKGWIEVRGDNGELLDTGEKRQQYGKKLFYRLGPKLLGRVKSKTSANNAQVEPVQMTTGTSANDDTKPVQPLHPTKESITKEIFTKETPSSPPPGTNGETKNLGSLTPTAARANRLAGKPYSNPDWLLALTEADIAYYQEEFIHLSADEIRREAKASYYWQKDKGKIKKDNRSFLRNWLRNQEKWNKERSGGITYEE